MFSSKALNSQHLSHLSLGIMACVLLVLGSLRCRADEANSQTEPASRAAEPASANPLEWEYLTGNWFGLRDALREQGIDPQGSIIIDWSHNCRGGLRTRSSTLRHLLDLNLTLDLDRLVGVPGGTFFVQFLHHHGPDSSTIDTGDFQVYSNIDADGRTELAQLWYRQDFFDGLLGVKFGKSEANDDFAFVDHGAAFIHSSPGVSPTVLEFPTYPDTAVGVILFVNPTDFLYANVGLFDGALHEGHLTGEHAGETFFGQPADWFVIGELGVTWEFADGCVGRLGVGGWGHTGDFTTFAGQNESGTAGWYLVLDQTLYCEQPDDETNAQGLGLFFQLAGADEEVAEVDLHCGIGVQYVGLLPSRDDDIVGVMVSYVHFSAPARQVAAFTQDYEMAFELFYKLQLTPWLALQPDLQYIKNPGGNQLLRDAVVATLRIEATF